MDCGGENTLNVGIYGLFPLMKRISIFGMLHDVCAAPLKLAI
jgi:hypothetical protein